MNTCKWRRHQLSTIFVPNKFSDLNLQFNLIVLPLFQ